MLSWTQNESDSIQRLIFVHTHFFSQPHQTKRQEIPTKPPRQIAHEIHRKVILATHHFHQLHIQLFSPASSDKTSRDTDQTNQDNY